MKAVKVLYFASLRELLGKSGDTLPLDVEQTALTIWQTLNPNSSLPESCLIAINQEYAAADSIVNAGDELAFFPPVTGG
ncbi:molybdopterin converting factor subunit 1 [Leucothrix pacifica]|uniref:Molybdopterin synthase sulfur carrier subunit n=1 Tax=Leucothrix pacifica TaxID=1247513 RepID=A0A317CNJ3_9GAMM|nr:molybdopterin converting factor subunit 1 [Leucothrix pacifica]PWR00119.1 molybdopterin converting factor subunit 1 [Leucothrix pacifica]